MSSVNRDLAKSMGAANAAGTLTSSGTITGNAGITVVTSADSLPSSGNAGDRAFVDSSNRYYIHSGSGWYNIALINTNPSITSIVDSDGTIISSSFALSKTGSNTVITITASDPEGVPITFTATSDAGFDSMATVSQDGQVFTITPMSEDSAVTTSGSLTFRASDGVNVATAVREFTLNFSIEASKSTRVHLKSVGNNKTNTTFTDSSSNSHTSTTYGNVANQFFTPYHAGGYSVAFDGSGDYITCGSTRTIPTTAFTVTAWVYFRDTTQNTVWAQGTSGSAGRTGVGLGASGTWFAQIGSTNVGGGVVPEKNRWYFTELQWDGSTLRFFVDGLQLSSGSVSTSPDNTTLKIGDLGSAWATTYPLNGFVRDVKVVSGTPTGSSTVPTLPATVTTGTQLLACNLPYMKDASSNNVTLTPSGNPTMRRFTPFDFAASPSSDGSSVYFDGTGDYLAFHETADDAFTFGTGDLTAEAWVYPTAGGTQTIITTAEPTDYNGFYMGIVSGNLYLLGGNGSSWTMGALNAGAVRLNQWTHIAYVRSGNTHTTYVNGAQVATETNSVSYGNTNNAIVVGGRADAAAQYFTGYISDARVVKGTAVYTSNFTPPTAPLAAIANTSLLTCNDAPDIYDTSGTNRVQLFGNATNTTGTENKYGSSVDLDGSGDYVQFFMPDNENFQDLDDFSFEVWCHLDANNITYPYPLVLRDHTNTGGPRIIIRFGDSGFGYHLQVEINGTGISNVWNVNLTQSNFTGQIKHIAVSRKNGYVGMWVNGTRYNWASGVDPSTFTGNYINYNSTIGNLNQFYCGYAVNGQLEDIRLTVGEQARYPNQILRKNFTSDSNTKLLTGNGSTIIDTGPDTQTITVSGPVVSDFGPAPGMKSIYFDGSNDYLRCDAALDFGSALGNHFTIEAWVYFLSAPAGFTSIFGVNYASNGTNHVLVGQTNGSWIGVWDNGSDLVGRSIVTHKWYHVAVSFNASADFEFWVNGGRTGRRTNDNASIALADCTFLIGAEADAANGGSLGNYFNGYMSNIRVSNIARYGHNFTPPTAALTG